MGRLIAVLWLAVLSGCAALSQAPEVSLAGLNLVEFGLIEQRFGLRLRFLNPNDAELRIDGLSYELDVNGKPFARGVSAQAVTVPRYGEALVDVDAVSNIGTLLRQLSDAVGSEREAVTYRLTGSVHVGGMGRLPFEHRGEVTLPRSLRDLGKT